jgi:TRAP-type C4-dicarboxylate transport system permease large subunit
MTPPTLHIPLLAVIGVAVLVGWRLVRRVRRLVGRQVFRATRSWFAAILFPLLILGLLISSHGDPLRLSVTLAGAAIGVTLALYGLRFTKFEDTPEATYYTPSMHIGVALSLLLTARVLYRFVQLYFMSDTFEESGAGFGRSPLTLAIVATVAGYYGGYAIGLIRRMRAIRRPAG